MNHFILLIICFFSVEFFIRSNSLQLISSLIKVSQKAIYIVSNKNISDHWKENIIPKYSIQMMKYSLQILLIFLFIISIFLLLDNLKNGFINFLFSWNGLIESILFAFGYSYLRKIILK